MKQIPNYSSYSVPEYSLFYSPKRSSYLAVVAIDFGTTYSGFAFSFNKDRGRDSIFMNMDWVNEQGSQTSKTPTCLLLKPDLSFDSFGYDAIEKYAGLEGDGGEKEYFFFKHFKMTLHNDQVWSLSLAQKLLRLLVTCMRTLKAQLTNMFLATVNQMFGGSYKVPTAVERAAMKSLSTVPTTKHCSAIVATWEERPII